MNYRTGLFPSGRYYVEYEGKFMGLFWKKWKKIEFTIGAGGGICNESYKFDTEDEAIEFIVKRTQRDIRKVKNSLASVGYTPVNISSKEVKDKFPEKFV